ncbi:MAG: F0F1 ATP synthase subunit A [Crocinitomicaceae bacterium]|nr:F0F1 ATP synthase subunit A [Crocinitomicaceae bacterium]
MFLILTFLICANQFAISQHGADEHLTETTNQGGHTENTKFNAAAHAIHHAMDAHEFHFTDNFVIPLPVILWTDKGLVTFMSSEFHHDDAGKHIVEKDGMKFVKFHEKIYQLNEGEKGVIFDGQHHPLNAFKPLDISLTKNVVTMLLVGALMLWLFIASAKHYKSDKPAAPKGIAAFTEPLILFVRSIAQENIHGHDKYKKFMPYLLTVFFFILFGNILGLIPFLANPNMTGSISVTIVLAAFTFVVQMIYSKKGFWSHIFLPPGVPVALYPILVPIEFAGIFIKPAALIIRLFANITAGHIIVVSLIAIIFVNENAAWAGLSVPMTLFISVLELLVAFLQAYIFTMLSALFIGTAAEEAHH